MALISEDIKKMNSVVLLKKLYQLKNATMQELIGNTGFSQSLVRSLLVDLKSKGILEIQNVDKSSGGRCPSRYSFCLDKFSILSVFNDECLVHIELKDIFGNQIDSCQVQGGLDKNIETTIIKMVEKYQVNCVSIGSSGVVKDLCFYTDQGEYMTCFPIASNLQKVLDIPVIIENDVKSMVMGMISKKDHSDLVYLYMSDTGVGSAHYSNKTLTRGHQSFAGELGLIPYQKKSINQVIASSPSLEVLEDIYVQLLTTVLVTYDPETVIITGKKLKELSLTKIKTRLKEILSQRYQLNIDVSNAPLQDALEGLHYLGVMKLFDIYTNYKRG